MALRLAKKATGGHETVSVAQNYHGSTMGSASAGGMGGYWREGYGPFLAGTCVVPLPYYYRLPMCRAGASIAEADDMLLAITEDLIDAATTGQPAAFILEPLMAGAGMLVPSDKWMRGIRKLCRERGIMMIMDEALTGIGRTGKWFCFEHFDIVPDIVTTSKGLGGGLPICGITTSDEIAQRALDNGFMHFSSHSGDPLLCAPALKNIEIIERDGLIEHVRDVGDHFLSQLKRMEQEYEIVGEARGLGLVLGLETVMDKKSREPNQDAAYDIAQYCFENKLWLTNIRPQKSPEESKAAHRYFPMNIVRLMPPMIVTREQVDEALVILEGGIRYAQERTPRPVSVAVG
jgi:2,2-dialkylglycine decarboxylase (pyruvate)